jgi:hypothetical protein
MAFVKNEMHTIKHFIGKYGIQGPLGRLRNNLKGILKCKQTCVAIKGVQQAKNRD